MEHQQVTLTSNIHLLIVVTCVLGVGVPIVDAGDRRVERVCVACRQQWLKDGARTYFSRVAAAARLVATAT